MRPKKVVLCVDDDPHQLSVLCYLLRIHGYRVLAATSGPEAIALFCDNTVELVLADHMMPNMDGGELIRELKKIRYWIPMVILGDLQKMMGGVHGADAILNKKCSPQELLERVKIMSQRKRGPRKVSIIPPEIAARA